MTSIAARACTVPASTARACAASARIVIALLAAMALAPHPAAASDALEAQSAARFAQLAFACVHKEYPNKIAHVLKDDADVRPPRALTPAFYGCYDWHSAVHAHWLLARIARQFPGSNIAGAARGALAQSLTPEKIGPGKIGSEPNFPQGGERVGSELDYLRGEGRTTFERPYGLAWLLALASELRTWDDPEARAWAAALAPLESEAAARITSWLPKLHYPIRVGEHSQTAFAFGLIHDWAKIAGDSAMLELLGRRGRDYYLADRDCPIGYEPSGEDFLSPCLAEADFMRRILPAAEYAKWLTSFLPLIPTRPDSAWLTPGVVTDRSDPKLAHIDGLNLSRAWMLEGIAAGLPKGDRRVDALLAAARAHAAAALPAVTGEHYEGGHWLGTFATYLTTQAGLPVGRINASGSSGPP
jgi:Protein of unknown function (DUF2891)